MRVKCYEFKFVDHDAKNCTIIEIHVHCSGDVSWKVIDPFNLLEHPDFLEAQKRMLWEMQLRQSVEDLVVKKYFNGENVFSAFKLVRERMMINVERVNLNIEKDTNEQELKKIKGMEMYCYKYIKGKTNSCIDIYYYTMIKHFGVYLMEGEFKHDYDLKEICAPTMITSKGIISKTMEIAKSIPEYFKNYSSTYKIPGVQAKQVVGDIEDTSKSSIHEFLPQVTQEVPVKTSQIGGGYGSYHNKYKKYKNKYVNLKKGIF
jgi:hypothetical protein